MSGSNPLAVALGQVGSSNPLQYAAGYADLATKAQALKTSQFNLGQAQQGLGYQEMRMLAATNPNASDDDVNAAYANAARRGGNVDAFVQNYANFRARGGSPADWVRAQATGGMSPENQFGATVGGLQTYETPQGTLVGMVGGAASPTPGRFTLGTGIAKGLSPEQWAQPTTVWDPTTQTQKQVPFGQAWQYSQPPGLGGGGGGGGPATGGGGGAGVGGSALLPPGAPADVAAARIDQIAQRESGGQNIPNRMGPGGTPLSSASGPYQFLDSTWQQAAREYGIPNPTPRAMDTDPAIQRAVAIKFLQTHGEAPWATSAPGGGGGAVAAGPQQGPFIGATAAQPVAGPGANVRPAGGPQYLDPMGRPMAPGGGIGAPGGGDFRSLPLPPPGFEKTAGASVDMFNNARANYSQQAQRVGRLEQSLATLRAHPDLQTGMTAGDFQNLNSLAQVLGVQLSPETIADGTALTEITKNLNNYYRSLPGAGRSDMAELDAKLSNPSPEMQRNALDELLARTIGLERMNDAAFLHFQELHPGGTASASAHRFADEVGQYTAGFDSVGFGFDKMTPQQRHDYYQSLGPTEKTRLEHTVAEAARLYHLPIPGS